MGTTTTTTNFYLSLIRAALLSGVAIGILHCGPGGTSADGNGDGDGDVGSGGEVLDPGGVGGLVDGGDGTGGSTSSGGMSASGDGDAASFGGWDDVRCYDYFGGIYCDGIRGTFATQVLPTCTMDKDTRPQVPPETALQDCGAGPNDPQVWDEVRCFQLAADIFHCWGGTGGWWAELASDCDSLNMGTPVDPNGRALERCGIDAPATGWDEIQCTQEAPEESIRCTARHGNYWLWNVFPSCSIDEKVAEGSGEVEPSMSLCD